MLSLESNVAEAEGDATVVLPAEWRLPDEAINGIKALLAVSFPSLTIRLVTLIGDADLEVDDFMAYPVCRIVRGNGKVSLVGKVSAETCDEIVEALQAFRAAGWRRHAH